MVDGNCEILCLWIVLSKDYCVVAFLDSVIQRIDIDLSLLLLIIEFRDGNQQAPRHQILLLDDLRKLLPNNAFRD